MSEVFMPFSGHVVVSWRFFDTASPRHSVVEPVEGLKLSEGVDSPTSAPGPSGA